ncbi:MAG: hypothetical protein O3C17_15565 [Planctomycetota bacterium]|nr:hypothetical protein [Planctomycetota bacterium]
MVSCLTAEFCQADEGLFDADPKHPWNRLHEQLHTRRTPEGEVYRKLSLEPLLVRQSTFLIQGESHRQALQVLDDFLEHHAEKRITDPRKQAILQRDPVGDFCGGVRLEVCSRFKASRAAAATGAGHAPRRAHGEGAPEPAG